MAKLQWEGRAKDGLDCFEISIGSERVFSVMKLTKEDNYRAVISDKNGKPEFQTLYTDAESAKKYCEFLNDMKGDTSGNDLMLMMIDNFEAESTFNVKEGACHV